MLTVSFKQKAYKKAALKYHPDRNLNNKKESEEKFKVSLKLSESFSNVRSDLL